MARIDWEWKLKSWRKPLKDAERERCEKTLDDVKRALNKNPVLKERDLRIEVHGSYAHNTNVRLVSDIDILVCWPGVDAWDPSWLEKQLARFQGRSSKPQRIIFRELRSEVEKALEDKFGPSVVRPGNRAIRVSAPRRSLTEGNSTTPHRIGADVLVCVEHHRRGVSGIQFWPRNQNGPVASWPQLHSAHGNAKNTETGHRYKAMVRVLKRFRHRLWTKEGDALAERTSSYLLESLAYNLPNECFGSSDYLENLAMILDGIEAKIRRGRGESWGGWKEVNERRLLNASLARWHPSLVEGFIERVRRHVGPALNGRR